MPRTKSHPDYLTAEERALLSSLKPLQHSELDRARLYAIRHFRLAASYLERAKRLIPANKRYLRSDMEAILWQLDLGEDLLVGEVIGGGLDVDTFDQEE